MGKSKDGNVTCFMYTQMRIVGLAFRQDEKRSLEGILGGMRIVEDAKANPQHHRAMAVSSDRRTKRSSNWLSVNDPAVPAPKSVRKPLAIVANWA